MNFELEPVKEVLRSFLTDIKNVEKIKQNISAPINTPFNIKDRIPDFREIAFALAPDNFWIEDNAYTWIYAEAWHYRSLMLQPQNNRLPEYYLQPALPLYQKWYDLEKDIVYCGCTIPVPGDINLADYLQELATCVEEKNEKRAVWIKSLKSFVQYIREDIPLEFQGTLNGIFPYKMEIRRGHTLQYIKDELENVEHSYILRNIEDPVYPIDILAASDILQNLATVVLEGRPNSQHNAAEALGFAWLCHAVGSARLTTRENIVYETPLTAFKVVDPINLKNPFQSKYIVNIKTLYGVKDIPISKTLYNFLISLPRSPGSVCVFSKPISTLLRTLYNKGVKKSDRARSLGKITFLTFMSQATHVIGHRSSSKK